MKVPVIPFENLVLYPTSAIPLRILDPAYIRMMDECIQRGTPVALSLADVYTRQGPLPQNYLIPRRICGLGTVLPLDSASGKERLVIVQGQRIVELGPSVQETPFLICQARELPRQLNSPLSRETIDHYWPRLQVLLKIWEKELHPQEKAQDPFFKKQFNIEELADYLCTFLVKDREVKQILLETDSLYERIMVLDSLFLQGGKVLENVKFLKTLKDFETPLMGRSRQQ